MYVAGTTWTDGYTGRLSFNDAIDDIKIPFFQTRNIQRYKDAEQVLQDNPNINTLIGHSMGSSVILELNKANNDKFVTRTYAAPVFDPFPNNWEKMTPIIKGLEQKMILFLYLTTMQKQFINLH